MGLTVVFFGCVCDSCVWGGEKIRQGRWQRVGEHVPVAAARDHRQRRCQARRTGVGGRGLAGTATSTLFWAISRVFFSSIPSHARRVAYSTSTATTSECAVQSHPSKKNESTLRTFVIGACNPTLQGTPIGACNLTLRPIHVFNRTAMGGCYGWLLWVDADWCLQPDSPRLQAGQDVNTVLGADLNDALRADLQP